MKLYNYKANNDVLVVPSCLTHFQGNLCVRSHSFRDTEVLL